jgi:beta-lactamase regulating signal transducer with metallopeptidase domain
MAPLLDHLWQSTVFALAAGLLTLMLRRNGAHTRYWLWFAASMKFLVPLSPLIALGAFLGVRPVPPDAQPFTAMAAQWMAPFSGAVPVVTMPSAQGPTLTTILIMLWALGAVVLFVLWVVRWIRIDTIRSLAAPLARNAPIAIFEAPTSLEPGLFGIVRPVLLLPQGLAGRLTPVELDAVVAHEICHLKRRDNLTAALHMLVQALFWFYPLVWWLGARLIDERERACDEAVVASGTDAEVYAESVLKVCRLYLHSPLACASGVSGADLKRRMEAIMSGRLASRLQTAKKLALAAFAAASVAVPVAAGFLSADAQSAPSLPGETELAQNFAEQARPRTAVPFAPTAFDKFSGYYQLSSREYLHIFRSGDRFLAQFTGTAANEVFPESPVKFFAKGYPWQISFESDRDGRVTGLVLHHSGYVRPVPKVADAVAFKAQADLAERIHTRTPSRGTEAAVRRQIAALEAGRQDYAIMVPALAVVARREESDTLALFRAQGAFKTLGFKGVAGNGADVYELTFDRGQLEWRVMPLTVDGKVETEGVRQLP